jgi:hypothetical protein
MEWQAEDRDDLIGQFHNDVVGLIDVCKLTPLETVFVLRILADNIEKLFEIAVKNPKVEANNGS